MAVWGTIVAAQVFIATRSRPARPAVRGMVAIVAFPVVGGLLALTIGLAKGYWT